MPRKSRKQPSFQTDTELRRAIQILLDSQRELRKQHQKMRDLHVEMKESWHRYRNLFEGAPIGYMIADRIGYITECNRAASAMLDHPVLLRGQKFAAYVVPQDRPRFLECFERCHRGHRIPSLELQLRGRLRKIFPVQVALVRSKLTEGTTSHIRITLVDLTEIKAAQADLVKAKQHVEQRVEERTRELEQMNEKLSREVERRTRLEGQLLEVSERERRSFGQDLHDDTCQGLTGLALEFGALSRRLEKEGVRLAPGFKHIAGSLNTLAENVRRIARGLHPVCLGGGLLPALEELANDTSRKVPCVFKAQLPKLALSPQVELALYRIVQEALSNVIKHSQASRATVRLWRNSGALHLRIEDNGVGLPKTSEDRRKGMGLDILSYRARSIGGTLAVENLPRKGVRVACALPFSALPVEAVQGADAERELPRPNRHSNRQRGRAR